MVSVSAALHVNTETFLSNFMKKGWIIAGIILIVVAILWWKYSSQVYTDKKGEEAVKIISENPDAIFDPKQEKKTKEEIEKRK